MERVLIIGASGHIGTSAVIGALRSKREVLAVVRSQPSAETLFSHTGTKEGITVVEADPTSATDLQTVVDRVAQGNFPAFQHVYTATAYKATIPHLLSQGHNDSTWTMITGGAGDHGTGGVTALTQGALYSMANVASRELARTNIRFNEVYLNLRVDFDGPGTVRPPEFAENYVKLLQDKTIKGSRINVASRADIANLQYVAKI
ncbi:hypothetical protein KC318_g5888 [Hortaea werneckii]|nr:hypothetical protein KC334_g4736 [Hortaea werneckii]KAI7025391.1 hypothetical protein KC355_g1050 [Hortaea werneckii]KAI7667410.1 hypothetical protein KC318_g5888 [Hortaea werneckii]